MGSIFQKAQQEKMVGNLQTLLDSVKGLPEGSQERAEAYIGALERLVAGMKKEEYQRAIWDFSREKAQNKCLSAILALRTPEKTYGSLP